jgi:hypothetical protein
VNLVFATCDHQPLITADDQLLADALEARGVRVTPIPWTELDPHALLDAPPILLRSTWDYHRIPTLFRSWLYALEDSGRQVFNPPSVARGNVDKVYLKELETAGIAIPRSGPQTEDRGYGIRHVPGRAWHCPRGRPVGAGPILWSNAPGSDP